MEGAKLLWILAPSAIPVSVNLVYLGIAKVKKSLKDIILVAAAVALGTLGLSYVLVPHLGYPGSGRRLAHDSYCGSSGNSAEAQELAEDNPEPSAR